LSGTWAISPQPTISTDIHERSFCSVVIRPAGPMAALASAVCSRMSLTAPEVRATSKNVTAARANSGTASAAASFMRMGTRRNERIPL
jgi:hypothetical protein